MRRSPDRSRVRPLHKILGLEKKGHATSCPSFFVDFFDVPTYLRPSSSAPSTCIHVLARGARARGDAIPHPKPSRPNPRGECADRGGGAARRGAAPSCGCTAVLALPFGLQIASCSTLFSSLELFGLSAFARFGFACGLPRLRRCRPQQPRSVAASGWASPALPSAAAATAHPVKM